MKKFVSVFIAVFAVAVCICAFSLVACKEDGKHKHTWSATYTQDGDRHYRTCDGCIQKEYESHSYDSDGVCVCGKRKSDGELSSAPAELRPMATYFDGVKISENKTAVTDADGSSKTFEEVLDRQFEVLAQDILYRLYLTYGEGTYGTGSAFRDEELNFSYDGNPAKVVKNTALTDMTAHDPNLPHSNVRIGNLDCIYCYQANIISEMSNRLNNAEYINLGKAIIGGYQDYDGVGLTLNEDPSKAWIFNDYAKWNTEYRTEFKSILAKAVYGKDGAELEYDQVLARINRTGFTAQAEQSITDAIYGKVIGAELVNEDLRIYKTFGENEKSNIKNWDEESEIEKHYYKGYNITVPAIVSQALANKFADTDVSLYPAISRQAVTVSNSFDEISVTANTHGIALMPKANTPVTKLAFEITGDAGQTVSLAFKVISGGVVRTVLKAVTLTGQKQTVEVDLTSAGVKSMGAYDGNTASYTSVELFGNTDGENDDGNNCILLDLKDNGTAFTVKFTGLYNK